MKTMRYILSLIAVLSVLSLSAATFGTPYQAPKHRPVYITQTGTPMPTATMSSMDAAMMSSGSTLPMAAVSGTTTANDYAPAGPNRAKKDDTNGDGWEDEDDPSVPVNPNPLGDAALPLFLLACVYMCARAFLRNKKRAISR
jgi:hypothetical protein